MNASIAIWGITALSIAGVILRPFQLPEVIWAVTGAGLLVILHLVTPHTALLGIAEGIDVYLFLTGMMLLAEIARREGLFDWLAGHVAIAARGSGSRLFALLYVAGIGVTVILSNDATAVVLTPAVVAATRAAKVQHPLPYLLICAFIANAASFVLPISNPANLVIYGKSMPPLLDWLRSFLPASLIAIATTYGLLFLSQHKQIRQPVVSTITVPRLNGGGIAAAAGIGATVVVLIISSAMGWQLGLPTAIAGVVTVTLVLLQQRTSPFPLLRGISWGVLPLVAGLFVLVEALAQTGVIDLLATLLQQQANVALGKASFAAGSLIGFGSNLVNNLPAGLLAARAIDQAPLSPLMTRSLLVGVDLGPNLSVTGSLATILWLVALRREGIKVGTWDFLKLGFIVMPLPLFLALLATLVS
ncbi:arsenic transporter [Beijerinckia mobilis]|uniref:arsenic transporter n=1 Tax=Beijerinckia mobilis TaxID=231434 RepID=UPI00054E4297|nr:arsenic transporter [Beijerinckia mobilis]